MTNGIEGHAISVAGSRFDRMKKGPLQECFLRNLTKHYRASEAYTRCTVSKYIFKCIHYGTIEDVYAIPIVLRNKDRASDMVKKKAKSTS